MKEKKIIPPVSRKVINSSWKVHMNQIRNLSIPENQKIFNLVRNTEAYRVFNAIELYRELKRLIQIEAPVDTFYLLLKDGWMDKSVKTIMNDATKVYERRAIFILWFKYMERIGQLTDYKDVDGKRVVCKDNQPYVSFVSLWSKGWTLEYLQNNFEL